jgi:protocatechuate 3,4-dioxygenase, alpha subunit
VDETPSQTVGPFLHLVLPYAGGGLLVPPEAPGAVRITGRVLDGAGEPVIDALVEVWQADGCGRYHPEPDADGFSGFGRVATDAEGGFTFVTCKPGRVPWPAGGEQAPHLAVSVFARGLLNRVVARLYFPDEEAANAADPVLGMIPDAAARATLVAVPDGDGLRFDIRLQGDRETVFLAV